MKRFGLGVLVALGCVGVVPAVAQASAANVKGFVCQTGQLPAQRAMSITAVMRPVPGTAKLTMRFQLLKRARPHSQTASVTGPGLKSWITPKDATLGTRPGDIWIVKHPVVELAAPAYYRFRVTFRWLGSSGQVLGETSRRSQLCYEPGPDLTMVKGWAVAGTPGQYEAVIRNIGGTASNPFTVVVTDESRKGAPQLVAPQTQPFDGLGKHSQVTVSLSGASCTTGDMLDFTVSPAASDTYDNPTDDTIMTTCPKPAEPPAPASTALKRKHRTAPIQGVRGR